MAHKILIIDDDPVIVTYLSGLFENNGYQVAVASNEIEGATHRGSSAGNRA